MAGLVAADVACIVIQVAVDATDYGFPGAFRLSLETEAGLAQAYGYLQMGAAAALLFAAWRRSRGPSVAFWAAAFGYLALDDAFTIHERAGRFLVDALSLSEVGPFRAQDVGEALVYLVVVAGGAALFAFAEWRDPHPRFTVLTRMMFPLAVTFAFFAVALDLPGMVPIAVEDGGELLAVTAVLVVAAAWTLLPGEWAAGIEEHVPPGASAHGG